MLSLRCVAEFVDGGDVEIEEDGRDARPVSPSMGIEAQRVTTRVSTHRKFVDDAQLSHDPILHRLVLATRGRSVVSYTSLVQLLSAAECAAEGTSATLCQYYARSDSLQGLMALYQRGVDHRDISIGNVFLGTDPLKPAGFIADLDLSSISNEAIKAAYPTEHEAIISQLKDGEWRMVRILHNELL